MTDENAEKTLLQDPGEILDLQNAKSIAEKDIYRHFQDLSSKVANYYKHDGHLGRPTDAMEYGPAWQNFRMTALVCAELYKTASHHLNKCVDIAIQTGQAKFEQEIIAWVQRGPSVINRSDFLAFLCNKTSPKTRFSPTKKHCLPKEHSRNQNLDDWDNFCNTQTTTNSSASIEKDMDVFDNTVKFQALNNAMSSISMNPLSPGSDSASNDPVVSISMGRKRSLSMQDILPINKRPRKP